MHGADPADLDACCFPARRTICSIFEQSFYRTFVQRTNRYRGMAAAPGRRTATSTVTCCTSGSGAALPPHSRSGCRRGTALERDDMVLHRDPQRAVAQTRIVAQPLPRGAGDLRVSGMAAGVAAVVAALDAIVRLAARLGPGRQGASRDGAVRHVLADLDERSAAPIAQVPARHAGRPRRGRHLRKSDGHGHADRQPQTTHTDPACRPRQTLRQSRPALSDGHRSLRILRLDEHETSPLRTVPAGCRPALRLRRGCRTVPRRLGRAEDGAAGGPRRGRADRCLRGHHRLTRPRPRLPDTRRPAARPPFQAAPQDIVDLPTQPASPLPPSTGTAR